MAVANVMQLARIKMPKRPVGMRQVGIDDAAILNIVVVLVVAFFPVAIVVADKEISPDLQRH